MTRFIVLILSFTTLAAVNATAQQRRGLCPSGHHAECGPGYRCNITWTTGTFYCSPLHRNQPMPTPAPEPPKEPECRHPWVC